MMKDMSYRDRARTMTADELYGHIDSIYDVVAVCLEEGLPISNPWAGHGTALAVYGMVCTEEFLALRPHAEFGKRNLRFFIGAQFMMAQLGERIEKPPGKIGQKRKGVMAETVQRVRNNFTCYGGCGGRKGFTNRGDGTNQWWVCSQCGRPTEQWLRAQGDEVLNMFRGGPVDGYVYPTSLLLSVEGLRIPVTQYTWTTELVTSESTGRVARVWRYQPSQTPDSVALVGNTTTSTGPTNGVRRMSETTESTATETAQPAPAPQPVDVADLRPRREAIKASRTVVAKEAGITVAQLYRVETGGKRTTADEATNVREALTRLEAAHAEAAAAQAAAAPAAAPAEGAADPS